MCGPPDVQASLVCHRKTPTREDVRLSQRSGGGGAAAATGRAAASVRAMASVEAFGGPGIAPTWSSSTKDLVTTALGPSRLWVTLGYGIVNEVYWPATGEPQIRDLGFIVAGDDGWFELKRVNRYRLSTPAPHLPLARVVHEGERYTLSLEFLPDPLRDVLLISFELVGEGFRLYPLLAPHLGATGWDNTAWVEDGLFAQGPGEHALCLVAEGGFARASAGYVGASDGWQDFNANGRMALAVRAGDERQRRPGRRARSRSGVCSRSLSPRRRLARTRLRPRRSLAGRRSRGSGSSPAGSGGGSEQRCRRWRAKSSSVRPGCRRRC